LSTASSSESLGTTAVVWVCLGSAAIGISC
jgi:hypothetical protein